MSNQPDSRTPKLDPNNVAQATSELNNLLQIMAGSTSAIEKIARQSEGATVHLDALRVSIDRAEKIAAKLGEEVGGAKQKVIGPASNSRPTRTEPTHSSSSSKQIILVVDDEEMTLRLMERTLVEGGFQVVCAQSGFQCLDLFRQHPRRFAMILLDLTLPFMDGEETFRRMREIRSDVPVLLCTGFVQQERLAKMLAAGLSGFLRKPVAPDELVNIVRSTLHSAKYLRAATNAPTLAAG